MKKLTVKTAKVKIPNGYIKLGLVKYFIGPVGDNLGDNL